MKFRSDRCFKGLLSIWMGFCFTRKPSVGAPTTEKSYDTGVP